MNYKVGNALLPAAQQVTTQTTTPTAAKSAVGSTPLKGIQFPSPYANTTQYPVPATAGGLVMSPNNISQAPANPSQVGSTQIKVPGTNESGTPGVGATKTSATHIKVAFDEARQADINEMRKIQQEAMDEYFRRAYDNSGEFSMDENGEYHSNEAPSWWDGVLGSPGKITDYIAAWGNDKEFQRRQIARQPLFQQIMKEKMQAAGFGGQPAAQSAGGDQGGVAMGGVSMGGAQGITSSGGNQSAGQKVRNKQQYEAAKKYFSGIGSQADLDDLEMRANSGDQAASMALAQYDRSNNRRNSFTGGGSLTPQQLQIARLASPNAQIGAVGASGLPGGHYSAASLFAAQNPWMARQLMGGAKPAVWYPKGGDQGNGNSAASGDTKLVNQEGEKPAAQPAAQGGAQTQPTTPAQPQLRPQYASERPMGGSQLPVYRAPAPTQQFAVNTQQTQPQPTPAVQQGWRVGNAPAPTAPFSGPGWSQASAPQPATTGDPEAIVNGRRVGGTQVPKQPLTQPPAGAAPGKTPTTAKQPVTPKVDILADKKPFTATGSAA